MVKHITVAGRSTPLGLSSLLLLEIDALKRSFRRTARIVLPGSPAVHSMSGNCLSVPRPRLDLQKPLTRFITRIYRSLISWGYLDLGYGNFLAGPEG